MIIIQSRLGDIMKKVIISLGASILLTTMATEMVPTIVQADNGTDVSNTTEVTPGDTEPKLPSGYDNDAKWVLKSDGTLEIYGGTVGSSKFANGMSQEDQLDVKKVIFKGEVIEEDGTTYEGKTKAQSSTSNFFGNFKNLEEIDNLSNLDTSETTTMSKMFAGLSNLKSVNLSQLDISNAKDLSGMFSKTRMENLDLSGWNVSKVEYLSGMFSDSDIQTIDLSGWDVSNVKDFSTMFSSMRNLTSVNVSGWKISNSALMRKMFTGDSNLKKLDLSTWHNKGVNFQQSLQGTGITQLKVSNDTELNYSLLRGSMDTVDEVTELPVQKGYLVKSGAPAAQLIPVSELKTGDSGTYNYINPTQVTAKVTVESNRGQQSTDTSVTVPDDSSTEIEVPVPSIKGATSDKKTVKGTLVATTDDAENTVYSIRVTDPKKAGYVTYTGGETNTGGSSKPNKPSKPSEPEKPVVTQAKKLISIQLNNETAKLYHDDASLITDRVLSNDTDWYSDQKMVVNGDTYYRVANDEWVKANDAYVYENRDGIIVTNNKGYQQLTNAQGKSVTDRALGADTSWKTDRIADINGEKYYRVATNEFVPVDSVEIK